MENNMRKIRKKIPMTLQELARLSGVSQGNLSEIETGKVNPTILTAYSIAGALGKPIQRIFPEPK